MEWFTRSSSHLDGDRKRDISEDSTVVMDVKNEVPTQWSHGIDKGRSAGSKLMMNVEMESSRDSPNTLDPTNPALDCGKLVRKA